jgi:hypothetical protein
MGELTKAMGEDPHAIAVLLTCSDETARGRLGRREIGSELAWHVERSELMARKLDKGAPEWVRRVVTDGRAVAEIAAETVSLTGWTAI